MGEGNSDARRWYTLVGTPAFADTLDDPYRSDPLGLIAHYDLTSELAYRFGRIRGVGSATRVA